MLSFYFLADVDLVKTSGLPQCVKTKNVFTLEKYFVETVHRELALLSRNFCEKIVKANLHNFNTVGGSTFKMLKVDDE